MGLFKKDPIITFKCNESLLGAIPDPIPASLALPKWFRKMSKNVDSMMLTVKQCIPFKDAMSMGYILPLWVDINIVRDGDDFSLFYRDNDVIDKNLFENHSKEQLTGCPVSDTTFGSKPMKFINPWLIKTRPGWSCLFIQPINRFDDKFNIITGVVDTDTYNNYVNFPFILADKPFNEIIPKGTPLVQVIPFKRETWSHKIEKITDKDVVEYRRATKNISSVLSNGYRMNYWQPKKFK